MQLVQAPQQQKESVSLVDFGKRLKKGLVEVDTVGKKVVIIEKRFDRFTGEEADPVIDPISEKVVKKKMQEEEQAYMHKKQWLTELLVEIQKVSGTYKEPDPKKKEAKEKK